MGAKLIKNASCLYRRHYHIIIFMSYFFLAVVAVVVLAVVFLAGAFLAVVFFVLRKCQKAQLCIQSALVYGERGVSKVIPGFTPLVFDIEVVKIKPAPHPVAKKATAKKAPAKKTAAKATTATTAKKK